MQVEEIMSSPAVTVGPETTLYDATGTMLRHRIGSVVVVDAGPVGILTRSDILRIAYRTGRPLTDRTASDGMSVDPVTVPRTASVATALGTMEDRGIKKLPVMDGVDLVGIVTMTDIAQHHPDRVREVRETIERKDEWTD